MSPQNRGTARRTPPRRPPTKRPSSAVYRRRRLVVFGTPLVVLIAIVAMFSGGGSKPTKATLTGSPAPSSAADPTPTPQVVVTNATPSGPCADDSIQAIPSITDGVAGTTIAVDLTMTTTEPACTFAMSGKSVVLKMMSGDYSLWSSQDCPNTIPVGTVTLYNAQSTTVSLNWDGHQSNGNCGDTHPWVGPGNYQVVASVVGSTPATSNFALKLPVAKTITKTATPKPTAKATPKKKATAKTTPKH